MISKEVYDKMDKYLDSLKTNVQDLTVKDNVTLTEVKLGSTLGLVEEVGEFVCEVRKYEQLLFNKKKVENFNFEDFEDEAMDVLMSLLLLLKTYGIENLDKSILRKIEKNNKRGY